jgi:F-type H+-transporting ATPase subunit b
MTGGSESWLSWVFKIVNFALLVGILVKFAGKPLKDFFVNRHNAVKEKLDEAEKTLKDAMTLKQEYEGKLANLDAEVETFKKGIMEEVEREKRKMIDEATAFASKLKDQAAHTYQQEVKELMEKIKEDIAKLTIERAETLVADRFTKEDHGRMVEIFIDKMRSLN